MSENNKFVVETEYPTWTPAFQLKEFHLSNCLLNKPTGAIPTFLKYQYDLRVVDLSHNNLTGNFPSWLLENNTRLEYLNLMNNSFMGHLNLSSRPNTNMYELDVSDNKIHGQIPTNFDVALPNLEILNISKNALKGSIPPFFE